jgi:hypothetical protein
MAAAGYLFPYAQKKRRILNLDRTRLWYALVVTIFVLGTAGQVTSEALVDIINYCGEPISVHCKSHDSDLGRIMIDISEDFMFKFTANVFGTTLFWCSFEWGIETQYFPVWEGSNYVDRPPCSQTGTCLYKVAPDGFYWATTQKAQGNSFWTFYKKWSTYVHVEQIWNSPPPPI